MESPVPIGSDDPSLKELSLKIILEVLVAFKSSEIPNGLSVLDSTQIELLLKYVYKGFEVSSNSSSLLLWHEKLLLESGVGGILKVITDMKTV